jgi:hypothetical protein
MSKKNITDPEHSSGAEESELASSQVYPGWPPAELPQHECGLPQVGLPHSIGHGKEASEN